MALEGLRLAAGTLTVIPSGPIPEIDRPMAARAMMIAPLAVVPLAAVAVGVSWVTSAAGLPELVVGLLVVGTLALGSRGMHLDGLGDTVDGLGSGWDRERALKIMARGNTGPMGAVALMIIIGLQAAAVGRIVVDLPSAIYLGAIICCSRCALALTCRRGVPAAKNQGLGVAVAGSVPWIAAFLAWLAVAVILGVGQTLIGGSYALGAIAAVVAAVGVLLLVWRCVRRLGGVTGDVMGASIEVALTIMLVGVAV
ncbi:MAG TPA: adenosylcobinamide-GDP ribazoletransferase [Propionibacteriaceae bacterium]|jgi:adenosylcobinamide-GDP ribazoletransferase|nr:adenosylcobinamide-GDP ribazoletransferase [Propionibacteriaceae bacterium]